MYNKIKIFYNKINKDFSIKLKSLFVFYLMSLFLAYFIKPKHPTTATIAITEIIAIVVVSPAFNILLAFVFDDWILFFAVFFPEFAGTFCLSLLDTCVFDFSSSFTPSVLIVFSAL